ncbi:MAG: DUF120 domain-containing protein [Candidatus Micrarchaeota archaeon]
MRIRGQVIPGLGQGRFFLSLGPYQTSFTAQLGYAPFPGTLNIEVSPADALRVQVLKNEGRLDVPGFVLNGREFYRINLVRARLLDSPGVLIFPLLNHHPMTVLEFVAEHNLREKYKLKDGDKVEIQII